MLKTDASNSLTSTLQINEALRTRCYNKTITAEAVYTYSKVSPSQTVKKEATSGTIGKGTLTVDTAALTYPDQVEAGKENALDASKLVLSGSFLNSLNETVTWAKTNCAFASTKAPDSTGSVDVKVNISGYEEITVPVTITVKAAPPSIGGGSGGGSGGSGGSDPDMHLFDETTTNIPYGYIRFDENGGYKLNEYEYCVTSGESSAEWLPATKEAFGKGSGYFTESDTIYLRYKKRALTTSNSPAYFNSKAGVWVDLTGGQIASSDDELINAGYGSVTEASDSAPLTLTSSYIGTYHGKISDITVKNDSDVKLSVSGKTVTASRDAGLTDFTFAWYVDGALVSGETGSSFTLPTTYSLADRYVVRVEAKDADNQIHTATATVTVSN